MKKLFEIDLNSYQVLLNKEFVYFIPEFKKILDSDKTKNKEKAISIFTYIYFLIDFTSPLDNLDEKQKEIDSITNAGITEAIANSKDVIEAKEKYKQLQYNATPSLRTLESIKKGWKSLNSYLEGINFEERDKSGKLIYSPKEYIGNVQQLNDMFDEISKLETRINNEIKVNFGIRGSATLGDREIAQTQFTDWKEGKEPEKVKSEKIDYYDKEQQHTSISETKFIKA